MPSFSSVSVDASASARGDEEGDPYPPIHPLLCGAGKPEANTGSEVTLSWLAIPVAKRGEVWQQVIYGSDLGTLSSLCPNKY